MAIAIIFAAIIFIGNCDKNESQNERSIIENIDAVKFKELIQSGNGNILDVRTPEEVLRGKISNASTVNFYNEDFTAKINLIQKNRPIYVYCRSGARSSQAAEILKENGFIKIYNLVGGISGWENHGFPVVRPENVFDEKIQTMSLADFNNLLKTDKPVLANFHTQWCSPCIKMAPIVDGIAEKYKNKVVVVRIDIDNSKEIGNAYSIQGVPVFILFKRGEEKWKHNGEISETKLLDEINILIQ